MKLLSRFLFLLTISAGAYFTATGFLSCTSMEKPPLKIVIEPAATPAARPTALVPHPAS
jgi:hypothetical protein